LSRGSRGWVMAYLPPPITRAAILK
jgi:hypothetical protein